MVNFKKKVVEGRNPTKIPAKVQIDLLLNVIVGEEEDKDTMPKPSLDEKVSFKEIGVELLHEVLFISRKHYYICEK